MAQVLNIYNQFLNTITNKEINIDTDDLKVMLVSSSYTPNKETDKYKSNVTGEVIGSGYTAGGLSLKNITYTLDGAVATLRADNPKWVELNINNLKYAVIYDNTPYDATSPSTDAAKALIAYIDFGEALNIINAELEIVWNKDGIMKFSLH